MVIAVNACRKVASYCGPRKANGAIIAPVLMPVTSLKVGRVPAADQPQRKPAPNAPLAPPPESASTFAAPVSSSVPRGLAARACRTDSTTLCCNAGLNRSAKSRTLDIPIGVAAETNSLGTAWRWGAAQPAVLSTRIDTVAHARNAARLAHSVRRRAHGGGAQAGSAEWSTNTLEVMSGLLAAPERGTLGRHTPRYMRDFMRRAGYRPDGPAATPASRPPHRDRVDDVVQDATDLRPGRTVERTFGDRQQPRCDHLPGHGELTIADHVEVNRNLLGHARSASRRTRRTGTGLRSA